MGWNENILAYDSPEIAQKVVFTCWKVCHFFPVALFDSGDWQQEIAFRYAVDRINMDRTLLPKMKLDPRKDHFNEFDSFAAEKKSRCAVYDFHHVSQKILSACNFTQKGVGAIFGPQTAANTGVVKSICETLEIPNLLSQWDISQDESLRCTINLYPEPHILSKVFGSISDGFSSTAVIAPLFTGAG